ncbi:HAD-superfamily subfamily IB hydrolase, TIGR01490 [Hathewaya proteolytica DSM 3090]|uniref:HAD-superfamily subfamily IB hydrolase, TIGR01490 n=1 Tax=Hathewaya proteolytica DSM 3090 TaxID=1121331 RepID=A0A1M6LD93_9CLOT|nr:HAD-IB family hydrolase [Hathewaya proteolytica]SHJ69055.1 HAD-superfamily subfamily IB hydrolase, TIGR01490 [Hathewaya proteolytica DSM 3090]
MEKLALFDIDFTITKKETLLQFYRFMIKKNKKYIKYFPKVLYSGLCYGLGIHKEKRTKEIFMSFIKGISVEDMNKICKQFYHECLKNILYKDGIDKMMELRDSGYMVILISASPEFYLNTLYDLGCVAKIIGTRVKIQNNSYINVIEGKNCKGQEKISRLNSFLSERGIKEVDYKNSYMFSDSLSDSPLLNLVGKPYLINYKRRANFPVLQWE